MRGKPIPATLGWLAFGLKLVLTALALFLLVRLVLSVAAGRKADVPHDLLLAFGSIGIMQVGSWLGYRFLASRESGK